MTTQEQQKAGYITLKEAGERFGYSADYIGQLIRKGKLEGKQVYANVAWMTTPEAIEEYLAKEKRTGKTEKEKVKWTHERATQALFDKEGSRALTFVLYATLALLGALLLAVFYFLSVAVDHRIHERAKARALENILDVSLVHSALPPLTEAAPHEVLHFSSLTI
jgi:hypothetical protein